ANAAVAGSFSWDASATTYFFVPVFSFGDKKFVFTVSVFQGLKNLPGDALVNPRSFGPFTCDGTGKPVGRVLFETFAVQTDNDTTKTTGDWGVNVQGQLQGAAITSRRAYIAGFQLANANNGGRYRATIDPLTGASLNALVSNVTPPTS